MMKQWRVVIPAAATALAIGCNLRGFWLGGPREWWELAATAGYLLCWAWFLTGCRIRWQCNGALVWWIASAVCASAGFMVVTFDLDGFLLALPAMVLITPLSGAAYLAWPSYPMCYGLWAVIAAGYAVWSWKRRSK